jgi:hypothetical protein
MAEKGKEKRTGNGRGEGGSKGKRRTKTDTHMYADGEGGGEGGDTDAAAAAATAATAAVLPPVVLATGAEGVAARKVMSVWMGRKKFKAQFGEGFREERGGGDADDDGSHFVDEAARIIQHFWFSCVRHAHAEQERRIRMVQLAMYDKLNMQLQYISDLVTQFSVIDDALETCTSCVHCFRVLTRPMVYWPCGHYICGECAASPETSEGDAGWVRGGRQGGRGSRSSRGNIRSGSTSVSRRNSRGRRRGSRGQVVPPTTFVKGTAFRAHCPECMLHGDPLEILNQHRTDQVGGGGSVEGWESVAESDSVHSRASSAGGMQGGRGMCNPMTMSRFVGELEAGQRARKVFIERIGVAKETIRNVCRVEAEGGGRGEGGSLDFPGAGDGGEGYTRGSGGGETDPT